MIRSTNAAYWIAAQAGVVPLGSGMPGVGKTQTVYAFAKKLNRPVYTLIGSLRDPADIGGYPYPTERVIVRDGVERKVVYMQFIPPKWGADCIDHDGRPWIVFIDELTCCPPAVQAACLRVIAEKVVGDVELPDETMFLAACNPPEMAAGGHELEPPMANRLYHHEWETDRGAIRQGWASGLEFPPPTFPVLPADWKNFIGAAGGLVAACDQKNPAWSCAFPKDRAAQCGPWPSPRSVTNFIKCLAACQAVGAPGDIEHELGNGLIGEPACKTFMVWRDSLDLPDPEELLDMAGKALKGNGKMKGYKHPDRGDKVLAMLASVSAAVQQNRTPDRWEAGMHVIYEASQHDFDLAVSSMPGYVRTLPMGAKLSPHVVQHLLPKVTSVFGVA